MRAEPASEFWDLAADRPRVEAVPSRPARDLIVDVAGVDRFFGDVQALTDLTIEVPRGSITVLLGPNGAGKTTAIRMITGALGPDRGSVRVFGMVPDGPDGQEVRSRCGVVSAKPSLYDRLSGWDNLRYAAELYGLGRGTGADDRIREAATQFGIDAALDHQVGGYSTGMKTRLALARAVLHRPDLLLLDEPTSGLDPESAHAVLELIRDMTGEGRTVLMCTHLLLEAEGLADEVVVMQHGTSLLSGAPSDLARQFWPDPMVTIATEGGHGLDALLCHDGVIGGELTASGAELRLTDFAAVPTLVAALVRAGASITAVRPFTPTLEDLYFAVRREHGSTEGELPPPGGATGRPAAGRLTTPTPAGANR